MRTCPSCQKWRLLSGQCTVCASVARLKAGVGSDRLPTTLEAEAKVTKILDSAYYSVARLFPEEEEDSGKGGTPPKEATEKEEEKGDLSPRAEEERA